jgi:desampylase
MTFEISSELQQEMLAQAALTPGIEVCGLLLGAGQRITQVVQSRNVAADPACQFEIDASVLIAAHRAERAGGPAILGCYHSHPNARTGPSPQDADMADQIGWLWIIIAGGGLRGWEVERQGVFKQVALNAV